MTATAPAAPAKVYFTNLRTHARESQLDKLKRLIRRAGIEHCVDGCLGPKANMEFTYFRIKTFPRPGEG